MSPIGLDGGDLRLAIVDAGQGSVGRFADRLHLLCYGFDPARGVYTERITTLLALSGVVTLLGMVGGIFAMIRIAAAPIRVMNIAQFTTEASEYAARVDNCSICCRSSPASSFCLVTGAIVVFFALYYRGSNMPRGAVPERKSHEIEIGWTAATLFTFLFIFWWAASEQLVARDTARERAGDPRSRQTMDVAVPASERRARNQRATRARVHRCPARDDVTGCHPRSLSAGTATEAGHSSRPLHLRMVQCRQDWNFPFYLCRILRD